jgi:hypothetical protein
MGLFVEFCFVSSEKKVQESLNPLVTRAGSFAVRKGDLSAALAQVPHGVCH